MSAPVKVVNAQAGPAINKSNGVSFGELSLVFINLYTGSEGVPGV